LSYIANTQRDKQTDRQTDRQTDKQTKSGKNITSLAEVKSGNKHILSLQHRYYKWAA